MADNTEHNKVANHDPEHFRDIKGLGFVTALSTAGVPEDRVGELYDKYRELDSARENNLREAYDIFVNAGKPE